MRTKLFIYGLVSTLFACAGDDGDAQDTGSTGPGDSSDSAPTATDPSATMTADDDDPDSSFTDSGSTSSSSDDGGGTTTAGDTSGSTAADESSSSTTEPVEFALFSDAFLEGEGIPGVHHVQGGNESPPLNWVGAPAGTMSFAIFFHDITIDFEHSAIWNIPADLSELPQDVDHDAMPADVEGALQCRSWINEFGYGGPGSAANFYQFTIYAIDVAEIPTDEIDQNSELVDVRDAFEAHSLGTAALTGQSTGPN